MRVRLLIVAGLVLAVLSPAQSSHAGETDVPYCFDAVHGEAFPATKWLTSPGV